MYKQKFVFILLFCASLVLLSAFDAKSQEAEIDKIVKEVSVDSQKDAFLNYTYLMKFSYERHKKMGGRKFSRLYEAILPSRLAANRFYSHRMLLLEDSERLISSAEVADARKELAKELEKIEQEADTQTPPDKTDDSGGYWTAGFSNNGNRVNVNVLKLLQNSHLSNLQRGKIDGREIVTIDFGPKPDSVFEKNLSYLSKIEGQITIDEKDKRIIRIEGYAPGEFAKYKDKPEAERQKEIVFLFSQTRVFEGFWFPQTIRLDFGRHPEVFEPIEIQFIFSQYKRANVDVKDSIETPKDTSGTTTQEKQN